MKRKIIELIDVWKTYHPGNIDVPVIKGLNLIINEGEFIAIMGPSGMGKSTLVNIIGCIDKPDKGKIILGDYDISKFNPNELAQIRGKEIGFIFQSFNLIESLTALENIMVPMMFQNIPESERIKKAMLLLKRINLPHRLNHYPSELSGGEKQRIAIARALVNDPRIIIADEPTGNLDTTQGKNIMQILSELQNDNKTIIMVTHDHKMANYADRIEIIQDGTIIKDEIIKKHHLQLMKNITKNI